MIECSRTSFNYAVSRKVTLASQGVGPSVIIAIPQSRGHGRVADAIMLPC